MSQVYSTEPQTAGRVVLETTHGPLEINLWSRECPATTKFFLQLCLDGYYENVLFHRIVPNFLIQTGGLRYNPTPFKSSKASSSSSSSSAAISSLDDKIKELQTYRQLAQAPEALDRRSYELNTRIRFNHRGQVAMALPVESEGMGDEELALIQPQFFITLDEASELDGKHVCFGTVTGPTVFNALRIGNTDGDDESNRPTILEEAPRIERVKILDNPIHTSIVPTPGVLPWQYSPIGENADDAITKKRKKRKGTKNLNVLSFGDEMAEDEALGAASGIKSSHDVIETKRFSKKVDAQLEQIVAQKEEGDDNQQENDRPKDAKSVKRKKEQLPKDGDISVSPPATAEEPVENHESAVLGTTVFYKSSNDRRQEEIKMRGKLEGRVEEPKAVKEKPPKVSLVEARRAKYSKRGENDSKRKREEDTMAKFLAFQSKVTTKRDEEPGSSSGRTEEDGGIAARLAKRIEQDVNGVDKEEKDPMKDVVSYHGQVLENDDETKSDWMKTRFKCRKHQDLDAKLGGDGRDAMEDYEVVDEKSVNLRQKHQGRSKHHHKTKMRDKHKLV